jgi:hypothetical protein
VIALCAAAGVDLPALRDARASSTSPCATPPSRRCSPTRDQRTAFLAAARQVRKLFKALLPDPAAAAQQHTVAAIRVLAERLLDLARPPAADLDEIADAVDELLDRSVGAEEYVIRAAAEGSEPDPLIDLSQIDFDALAARFAGRKRAETDRLAGAPEAAGRRGRHPQPDPLRPGRADRGADRRVQRRQPQHRRVPAAPRRAVPDPDRRGAARRRRGSHRRGAGDLRSAHQARAGPHRRRASRSSRPAPSGCSPTSTTSSSSTGDARPPPPPMCGRPSVDILDADLPPTRTRPRCSTPRSRPSSTTSPPPTATTAPASTTADTPSSRPPRQGAWSRHRARGMWTLPPIADEVVERIRHDAEFASLVADKLGLTGGAACARRGDHRERRGLRRRVQVHRPLGPTGEQAQQGDGGRHRQDRRRVPQHRRRHPAHRRRRRRQRHRPRPRLPACEADQRRRLRQLAHHPPHQRPRPHPRHPHPSPHRRHDGTTICRVDVAATPSRSGPRPARPTRSSSSASTTPPEHSPTTPETTISAPHGFERLETAPSRSGSTSLRDFEPAPTSTRHGSTTRRQSQVARPCCQAALGVLLRSQPHEGVPYCVGASGRLRVRRFRMVSARSITPVAAGTPFSAKSSRLPLRPACSGCLAERTGMRHCWADGLLDRSQRAASVPSRRVRPVRRQL